MGRGTGLFICMVGLALCSMSGQPGRSPTPAEFARASKPGVSLASIRPLSPTRIGGDYRALIDGKLIASPLPPIGEPVTLMVVDAPLPVRAVRLENMERYAPYYLAEDGRMLETRWRLVDGVMKSSVRYRRGMLEIPSPT